MTPKERPILFSGPMVRAILDGRKTQTRRVVNPQPKHFPMTDGETWFDVKTVMERFALECRYGIPGEHLYVRETWHGSWSKERALKPEHPMDVISYRADFGEDAKGLQWRPSIHMPRWASRITLEVVNVRVERLLDISEEDAKAEGVEPKMDTHIAAKVAGDTPYRMEFWHLWETINAKRGYGWTTNPWVFVVEFKRI